MSRRRWTTVLGMTLILATAIAACSGSSPPTAGRLSVDGQAEVTRPGEGRTEVSRSHNLEVGDRVRVRQGTAVIRLPDDRLLELREGSDIELQETEQRDRVRPSIMAGDLLVVSDREALPVIAAGAEVAVHGDARISRGVALLVATYEGTAQLSAGGSSLAVPALRQAALLATGQVPTGVGPLEFSTADGWDQRYLSDAIQLTSQLDARSQGFTAQLGSTEGRSYTFFRDLFPRLASEPAFTAPLVNASRPSGETLVGAAITVEGNRGPFAERWAAVFTFRDQGAPWGLVALDQGVNGATLLQAVESAISRGPTLFAGGPASGPPSSLAPPSRGGSPATTIGRPAATTTTVAPAGRPGGQPTTTTTPPPTTAPDPTGPLNTGNPFLDETVNSLVDTLTGLLRSLGGP